MRALPLLVPMLIAVAPATLSAQETDNQRVIYPASYFDQFHPNTAYDMVLHVPGFVYAPGDPNQRGIREAAGNVVIDGRRLADKDFALDQVLQHIPAGQVDRIELLRGTPAGIDMLGQPVVANVVRRRARGTTGAITLSDGLYLDGRTVPGLNAEIAHTDAGGRSLSATVLVSRYVEVNKGDGERTRTDGLGSVLERADVRARSGGETGYAQGAFETPMAGGHLRLDGSLTWTDYHDRQRDTTIAPVPIVSTYDEELGGLAGGKASAEAGLHYSRNFGGATSSETNLIVRNGWQDYSSLLASLGAATGFSERDRTQERVLRIKIHHQASPPLAIEGTAELAANRLVTSSRLAFNGIPIPLPDADATVTEGRADGGVELVWNGSRALQLSGGLHAERSVVRLRSDVGERHPYAFAKPVLRLSYQIGPGQQLRLRVEREVNQLAFSDFIAAAALDKGAVSATSARIAPQHDWAAEVSYELRTRARGAFALTLTHLWLNDVVDWVPVVDGAGGTSAFDTRGNIGNGDETRASFTGNIRLDGIGIRHATLNAAATWDRARVTDPVTHARRRISDLKPFVLSAGFQQDLIGRHASWGLSLDGPWRMTAYRFNSIDRESASAQLDLFAQLHPHPGLSLRLDAKDVLRRHYGRVIGSFSGLRAPDRFLYDDARTLSSGPSISVSVRKEL